VVHTSRNHGTNRFSSAVWADLNAETPAPILINSWKHHAGFIRNRVAAVVRSGRDALNRSTTNRKVVAKRSGATGVGLERGHTFPFRVVSLEILSRQLHVIGHEQVDLYTGSVSLLDIGKEVTDALRASDRLPLDRYRDWLATNRGYQELVLREDGSRWILRIGDEAGRYVHVHPARGCPRTRRVRANVLKTTIMVRAFCGVHGGDPGNVELINEVRQRYLGLAPVRRIGNRGQEIGNRERGKPISNLRSEILEI
jgi:hypothetical protein